MNRTRALILAAGKGKKMQSEIPKVLLKVSGKIIVEHVINALQIPEIEAIGLVINPDNFFEIKDVTQNSVNYIFQENPKGTGHAVMCAKEWLADFDGNVIIVVGDAPFITQHIMSELIKEHKSSNNVCTLLSAIWQNPPAYGRIIRDSKGKLVKIVEQRDATAAQRLIKEVSTMHYIFKSRDLFQALSQINNYNAQGEYYLPDVVGVMIAENKNVAVLRVDDHNLTRSINTLEELNE